MHRPPRLKTGFRVAALLRRANGAGAAAVVVRRGDEDAGAVAVKLYLGRIDGAPHAQLFFEEHDEDGRTRWRDALDGPAPEPAVDARLEREAKIDRDLWVVEIEARDGFTLTA